MQVELDGKPITLLKKGSYFGELALLRDMRRTASVRVVSETCDLFVLTKVRPCITNSASHETAVSAWFYVIAQSRTAAGGAIGQGVRAVIAVPSTASAIL